MSEKVEYRSYDGRGNNKKRPNWGAAGSVLRRVGSADYAPDGFSPRSANPRDISNKVCFDENRPSPQGLSDFIWAWGQFLDHEIDITPESEKKGEGRDITIPDDVAVPDGVTRPAVIKFQRSEHEIEEVFRLNEFFWEPEIPGGERREQVNALSSFIDAANVYGANCKRATALRRLDGSGKLRSQSGPQGEMLPFGTDGLINAHGPNPAGLPADRFLLAGDVRCNEHVVLASMHTLFMREHNRLCDEIRERFPREYVVRNKDGNEVKAKSDEKIYQAARKVVGALMQVVTYNEFLPAILGEGAIPEYDGYDDQLDPGIANEFSTAFYRLGHSMLSDSITLGVSGGSLTLREMFFSPEKVLGDGIEEYLGALHTSAMQNIDTHVVDSVRNFLFNPPGFGPNLDRFLDLVSLNIQRGRDHGLPNYNACRTAYGLATRSSFGVISSDQAVVEGLEAAYGSVGEIDPWVGALAEDTVDGAAVGELTRAALVEQFVRLRDGDRFWWRNDPAHILREMRDEIEETTLGDILNRNTSGISFPGDVFHV